MVGRYHSMPRVAAQPCAADNWSALLPYPGARPLFAVDFDSPRRGATLAPKPAVRMSMRNLALRLLLALLLVVSQQQAVLHMLSHGFEEISQNRDQGYPHQQFCERCVAFAGLDKPAVSADAVVPQTSAVAQPPQTPIFADADCPLSPAYLSRAPPPVS
jgi:hypothetical protein